MSVNYASGLSPFPDKGECGQPETFDSSEAVEEKISQLASWIREANGAVVVHTGAGISTSCGIPDFRGPTGVWTLEQRGEEPAGAISFVHARPGPTHMALMALEEAGWIRAVITQNVDGLHLRSGFPRNRLAILHGDMFTEECDLCHTQFSRPTSVPTMGLKRTGGRCGRSRANLAGRCRGYLRDTILDWEDALPDTDLDFARAESTAARLSLCLGSSLQIVPGGELPLLTKPRRRRKRKRGQEIPDADPAPPGRIAIVNLQVTKRDKDCDLKIHAYVDRVMRGVCERLGVVIPSWGGPRIVLLSKHTQPNEKFKWRLIVPEEEEKTKKMKPEEEKEEAKIPKEEAKVKAEGVQPNGDSHKVEAPQAASEVKSEAVEPNGDSHRADEPQPVPEVKMEPKNGSNEAESPKPNEVPSQLGGPRPVPNEGPSQLGGRHPVPNEGPSQLGGRHPVSNEGPSQLGGPHPVPNEGPSQPGGPHPVPNEGLSQLGGPHPVPNEGPSQLGGPHPVPDEGPSQLGGPRPLPN